VARERLVSSQRQVLWVSQVLATLERPLTLLRRSELKWNINLVDNFLIFFFIIYLLHLR
jgi:hypothetical protein